MTMVHNPEQETIYPSTLQQQQESLAAILEKIESGRGKVKIVNSEGSVLHPAGKPIKLIATLVRPADTDDYAIGDAIRAFAVNVKQKETVTLSGSAPVKQKETVTLTGTGGTAEISGSGELLKTAEFNLSLTQTAADFVTAFAADYLAVGIVLTSDGEDLILEGENYDDLFDAPVVTNLTEDLAGIVVHTTAAVAVGVANLYNVATLNRNVTWDGADEASTATKFVTDNAAAYLEVGIVLTSDGADLVFEAAVAGVPFNAPIIDTLFGDLDGAVVHTTPNATIAALAIQNAAIALGGGGKLTEICVVTDDVGFAGKSLRIWLYSENPSAVVGDNVAMVNLFADAEKLLTPAYVDITFDAQSAGSDCVIGKSKPDCNYVCAAGENEFYLLAQSLSVIADPKSAGIFKFICNVVLMS